MEKKKIEKKKDWAGVTWKTAQQNELKHFDVQTIGSSVIIMVNIDNITFEFHINESYNNKEIMYMLKTFSSRIGQYLKYGTLHKDDYNGVKND